MSNQLKAKDVKEQVSIVDLLAALGYAPAHKTGGQYYYNSMLRDNDNDPSFVVKDETGQWFDHGLPGGGDLIAFGLLYWKDATFPEVLQKIVDTCGKGPANNYNVHQAPAEKIKKYGIREVKELGHNAILMNYLESRGIARAAEGLLKEVYYYAENEQGQRSNYYAAGWQNEKGTWVVRNANYKICLGPSAISFLPGDPDSLSVFEGMMDYLSWKTNEPFCEDSILVLNSLALIQPALNKAKAYANIATYFDNDSPGRAATTAFQQALPQSIDHAWIYEGYKDYNEKLVAETIGRYYER